MQRHIYTERDGIHILDLDQTLKYLEAATNFLKEIASLGEKIIFVSTKKQAQDIIKEEASSAGALYVNKRWIGGTLTNFESIIANLRKLEDLERKRESHELEKYTKKERLLIDREIGRLDETLGGLRGLDKLPAALVVVDTKKETNAVREARKRGVKIVGVVDSNCDPTEVDYAVPANDDALKSIRIIVKTLANSVEEGYQIYNKKKEKEKEPSV